MVPKDRTPQYLRFKYNDVGKMIVHIILPYVTEHNLDLSPNEYVPYHHQGIYSLQSTVYVGLLPSHHLNGNKFKYNSI